MESFLPLPVIPERRVALMKMLLSVLFVLSFFMASRADVLFFNAGGTIIRWDLTTDKIDTIAKLFSGIGDASMNSSGKLFGFEKRL